MEDERDTTIEWRMELWSAPSPGSEFHSRVRHAFEEEFRKGSWRQAWKGKIVRRAGMAACASALLGFLLVALSGLAFPQTVGFRLPWLQISGTMDVEEIVYLNDGTPYVTRHLRYVPRAGGGSQVLWKYVPEHPFDGMLDRIGAEGLLFLERITAPQDFDRVVGPGDAARSGCRTRSPGETVLREEKLLGYSTAVLQRSIPANNWRVTAWLAPNLGCRALKSTLEFVEPDGTIRPVRETRAIAVAP